MIINELRPCFVKKEKGLFHTWETYQSVVEPSPMIGGHNGGNISQVFGIVEFDNGEVRRVQPYDIKFFDSPLKKCIFGACELGEYSENDNE